MKSVILLSSSCIHYSNGYINTTLKVERIHFDEKNQGPRSLVFEKYGGNALGAPIADKVTINPPLV